MVKAFNWFMRNKTNLGAVSGFLSGLLLTGMSTNVFPDKHWLEVIAFVLSYSSMGLLGGGVMKSDDYYKDRAAQLGPKPVPAPGGGV